MDTEPSTRGGTRLSSGGSRPARRSLVVAALLVALATAACQRPVDGGTEGADPAVAPAIERSREANPAAWKRKVVLLGFDSCDPDLVDEMIRAGKLPHFARLKREGASGILESITPTLSPVVWTTIATGMPPERHGILDFVTDTPSGAAPVSSRLRQADTMWEILSRHGEQVGVVGWLVTWPAEPVNGFVATDKMGLLAYDYGREEQHDAPHTTYPEDLAKWFEGVRVTVDDVPLAKMRTFVDIDEAEHRGTYSTKFHPMNRIGNLRLTLATAETFRAAGTRLLAERRPRFFACYFEAMDAISHLFMRYAPPRVPEVSEADYLKFKDAIEANYVWHDTALGEFMDLADEDTTLIVVSDHGFKSGQFRRGDPSEFHAKGGAMWHRLYGSFFAWGNGVKRGARIDGARVYDIAPTVLAAMGYPRPLDMKEGRVLDEVFEGGLAYETVPTYFGDQRRIRLAVETAAKPAGDGELTPEQAAEYERMAALGYVSGDRKDLASTQINLGQRYLATGRFEEALAVFEAALQKERSPRTLCVTAEALLSLRRRDEARKLADEAVALDPTDIAARMLLTRLLAAAGETAKAVALARTLVAEKPDLPNTHGTLALMLEIQAKEMKAAGDAKGTTRARAEALAAHEAALRLEPNQIPSRLRAAEIILDNPADTSGPARAMEHLDRVLRLRPKHALALNNRSIAWLRLGVLHQLGGQAKEAKERLESAVEDATKAADAWRERTSREYTKAWANRAYALWKLDRMDEAFAAARKAREADPSYVFSDQLVTALVASGRDLPAPAPKAAPETEKAGAPGKGPGEAGAAPDVPGETPGLPEKR